MIDCKVNIDPRINGMVEQWIEAESKEIKEYGYSDKALAEMVDSYIKEYEKQFVLITTKEIQKDVKYSRFYRELLCNANNVKTRAFFEALTGFRLPKTESGVHKTFRDFFGTFLDEIDSTEKQKHLEAQKAEKEAKNKAEMEFFAHAIWDKKEIEKLTPMQMGRLMKAANKEYRFEDGVMSIKEKLEKLQPTQKSSSNNMWKWNRQKFNRMNGDEQKEYEEKLANGRTYECDGYEIPKILFDVMMLEDTTSTDLKK
jgi:hypothetical protein